MNNVELEDKLLRFGHDMFGYFAKIEKQKSVIL